MVFFYSYVRKFRKPGREGTRLGAVNPSLHNLSEQSEPLGGNRRKKGGCPRGSFCRTRVLKTTACKQLCRISFLKVNQETTGPSSQASQKKKTERIQR